MHLLSVALFAASANLDSLVVGLSCGVRRIVIGRRARLFMSTIAFWGTFLSIVLGERLGRLISGELANAVGGLVILAIGLWGLLHWWKNHTPPEEPAPPSVSQLSLLHAGILGGALAANNIALGVGAGMSGLGPLPSAVGSMLFSLVFLQSGNRLGYCRLTDRIGRMAEPAACLLMLALGCCELVI